MAIFLIPVAVLLYAGIKFLYTQRIQRQLEAENALRESLELPPLTMGQFRRRFVDTQKFRKGMNLHS